MISFRQGAKKVATFFKKNKLSFLVICSSCQCPIQGRFMRLGSKAFHPNCVRCAQCKQPISDAFHADVGVIYHPECFQKAKGIVCQSCGDILGGKWVVFEKKNYHSACLEKIIPEKCDFCQKGLVGNYRIDPWGQKVHTSHRLPTCDSCHRTLIKKSDRYPLNDTRSQCSRCHKSAVKSLSDISQIEKQVRQALDEMGISGLPGGVPISMLDLGRMKQAYRSHSENPKGLTKTHIRKMGSGRSLSHEIFILYGLPFVEFKGVLAHEFMHVWLHEKGIRLKAAQTEGVCNLASFFVYSKEKTELSTYLLQAMMKNPDPIYGQGYRSMLQSVRSLGWKNFLEHLTTKQDLNQSLWKKIFG